MTGALSLLCAGLFKVCFKLLGFFLYSPNNHHITKHSTVNFNSANGIRLIETRDETGEIKYYDEYLENPPLQTVSLSIQKFLSSEDEKLEGLVLDDDGEQLTFSLSKKDLKMLTEMV